MIDEFGLDAALGPRIAGPIPTDPRAAALLYASWGWYVFPLADGKVPTGEYVVGPGGERRGGFYLGTTDADVIDHWWHEYPDANVAVWLAASGLIAVDVDVSDGKPGLASYRAACVALGCALPDDCSARSHSGGLHFVMRDPAPEGRRVRGHLASNAHGRAIDVKRNGYIVLEPSLKSGRMYRWIKLGDPPPVPAAWVDALYYPAGMGDEVADVEDWIESSHPALAVADAERLRAALRGMRRCQGDHSTYRAVRTIHHDYGLSLDEGRPFLEAWNVGCGSPHLPHSLARAVERSATNPCEGGRGHARRELSWGERVRLAREPERGAPEVVGGTTVEAARAEVTRPRSALDVLESMSVASAVEASAAQPGTYEHFLALASDAVARYRGQTVGQAVRAPHYRSAAPLRDKAFPPTPWLVRGLATDSGLIVLGGAPKISKTWVMTELALAVATGTSAFGEYACVRSGLVCYSYTEDIERSVRNKLRGLCEARGLKDFPPDFYYAAQEQQISLHGERADASAAEQIASALYAGHERGRPVALITLDPLRNVHSAQENESDDMIEVMRTLKMIAHVVEVAQGSPCAIATPHHLKKPDRKVQEQIRAGEELRGSSAIWGAIDSGLYLHEAEGGDGEKKFAVEATSVIKSAKSAGRFTLLLEITDDANDEAVCARWTRSVGGQAATEERVATWVETAWGMLDELFLAEMQSKPVRTASALHERCGGNRSAFFNALAMAKGPAYGWVDASTRSGVLGLTTKGRAIARERANVPPEEHAE